MLELKHTEQTSDIIHVASCSTSFTWTHRADCSWQQLVSAPVWVEITLQTSRQQLLTVQKGKTQHCGTGTDHYLDKAAVTHEERVHYTLCNELQAALTNTATHMASVKRWRWTIRRNCTDRVKSWTLQQQDEGLSFLSYFLWVAERNTEHTVQHTVFTFSFSVKRCRNIAVINHHSSAEEFRPALLHKSCPMLSELLLNCDWGESHCRRPSDCVHDEHVVFFERKQLCTVHSGPAGLDTYCGHVLWAHTGSYTGSVFRTHAGSSTWSACFISRSQLTCVSTWCDTDAAVVSLWDVTSARRRTGLRCVQGTFHSRVIFPSWIIVWVCSVLSVNMCMWLSCC